MFATLGLCILYVSLSHESPVDQPCGHCGYDDTQCFEDCFDRPFSLNEEPACGIIRACIKRQHKPKMCHGVPITEPPRCKTDSTTPNPNPNPWPQSGTTNCECSGQTIYLNDVLSGNCNSKSAINGRYWCYVNPGNACWDETRAPVSGFFFSYHACDLRRNSNVVVPYRL
jgi:hypothetical protein